jgi:hypothetical protein
VSNQLESLRQIDAGEVEGFNSGRGLGSGRMPASNEDKGKTSGSEFQPVIAEPGMPHTAVNRNPEPRPSAERTGLQERAVIVSDLGFFPKVVSVIKDIPVKIFVTAASKKSLCFMMDVDGFEVRKQVRSQKIEEVDFTPTRSERYRFHCPINGMDGYLLVMDPGSSGIRSQ